MIKIPVDKYCFSIPSKPPILLDIDNFWVSSDQHLSHVNIMKYEPIRTTIATTIEEMDEFIINAWNDLVQPNDLALILGDVSLGNFERTFSLIKRMNGQKILILGNHDKKRSMSFWRKLFIDVIKGTALINGVIYSHKPVSVEYLYAHNAIKNIHGHMHSKLINDDRYLCVSVEQTDFKPIRIIQS